MNFHTRHFPDGCAGPFRTDGLQTDGRTDDFYKVQSDLFLFSRHGKGLHTETRTMLPVCQPSADAPLTPGLSAGSHCTLHRTVSVWKQHLQFVAGADELQCAVSACADTFCHLTWNDCCFLSNFIFFCVSDSTV